MHSFQKEKKYAANFFSQKKYTLWKPKYKQYNIFIRNTVMVYNWFFKMFITMSEKIIKIRLTYKTKNYSNSSEAMKLIKILFKGIKFSVLFKLFKQKLVSLTSFSFFSVIWQHWTVAIYQWQKVSNKLISLVCGGGYDWNGLLISEKYSSCKV